MEKRHNYEHLKIWKLGIEISKLVYSIIKKFPDEEKYGLSSQLKRAAVSIPSNIAEGSSRSNKSFVHFLEISMGSSFELQPQLFIAKSQDYIGEAEFDSIKSQLDDFQKMTRVFIKNLIASRE